MSDAETLRRAAKLMRERAERTAVPHHPYSDATLPRVETTKQWAAEIRDYLGGSMGVHAASWNPAVALAVADWLEGEATELAEALDALAFLGPPVGEPGGRFGRALAVANAYLGATP